MTGPTSRYTTAPPLPGLPIGLLTGYAHSPLIPAIEKSGMAVFKKPVLIQDLVEFLQREIG